MRLYGWVRLILSGLVTGLLFFVLTGATLALFGDDILAEVATAPAYPKLNAPFFLIIDLLMGVWAVWLYSQLSYRYGTHHRTAIVVGVAWWAMKSLQSANWVGLGFVPLAIVPVPLLTSLFSTTVAALAGGWLFARSSTENASGTA